MVTRVRCGLSARTGESALVDGDFGPEMGSEQFEHLARFDVTARLVLGVEHFVVDDDVEDPG